MGTRGVLVGVVLGVMAVVCGPAASAAPIRDLDGLPVSLQKYVPGTAAWSSARWMTAPVCAGRGGDFSVWVAAVLADTPVLLGFFQASVFGAEAPPADRPRAEAILAGYRAIGADLTGSVPAGVCVDDLTRWAGPDPTMRPFGFPWGVTEGDGHQSTAYCTDRDATASPGSETNRHIGAERAMCDGFYVTCDRAPEVEKDRCQQWNAFSDRYVLAVQRMRGQAIADHPAGGDADTDTDVAGPDDLAKGMASSWFENITMMLATGAVAMMAEAMTWWTRTDRGDMLQSPAITEVQALLRYVGFTLLACGVIWQGILMILRRKADPLVNIATGLFSFVAWSTLGGAAAVLLNEAGVALAGEVLDSSIDGFAHRMGTLMQVNLPGNVALVFNLSIILFFLSCVQWTLGFFRMGALAILLALIPTAAAGQLTERTKPWLPKIAGWCLALIGYQPVAAIIYSIGFRLVGDGQDVATVLVGMAVLVLAVVAMPALLRFFDWGGQRLVTGGGGGAPMAMGAAASVLSGAGGFSRFMDTNGPAAALNGPNTPGSSGDTGGAAPVSAAHLGDGPGTSAPGAAPTTSIGTGGVAAGMPSGGEVFSAVGAATPSTATAAGTATGAAGGPVGAAVVMGAQAAAAGAGAVAAVATGAMTDGAGEN